jgi:repressor LexA
MTVQPKVQDVWRISVVGSIVAGQPIPFPSSDFSSYGNEDFVEIVPSQLPYRNLNPSEVYALRVKGISMIDDMINDGDTVIMQKTNQAENGDTVAVWLPDAEETTLKRFYREKDRIRLQPANPTMDPIYISNTQSIEIQGKVLQTISSK